MLTVVASLTMCEERITKFLALYVKPGSVKRIVLVTYEPMTHAQRNAILSVEAFCVRYGYPDPTTVTVPSSSVGATYRLVRELVSDIGAVDRFIGIAGGDRFLSAVITVALVALDSTTETELYVPIDIDGDFYYVSFPLSLAKRVSEIELSRDEEEILQKCMETPCTLRNLSAILNKAEKTVAKHLSKLRKLKLIETDEKGNIITSQWATLLFLLRKQQRAP